MKQAGIRDVARAAGVSISTVSRAFMRPELVTEKTRTKVRDAAERLNFNISRSATSLKTGQTYRVALLINEEITSWFNTQVFAGINSLMHPAGYDISIFEHIDTGANRQSFFKNLPILRNVDAVFVASFGIDLYQAEQLRKIQVPIIGINVPSTQGFNASVSIDDETSMYNATQYVIRQGHRNLVFPCSQSADNIDESIDLREQGFKRACQDYAHLGVQGNVLQVPRGRDFADNALAALLKLPQLPDAICCEMDMMAIPLLLKLQAYGHQAPKDYSIIGFDDSPYADTVELTTMHQDPFDMGRKAALKALALIEQAGAQSNYVIRNVESISTIDHARLPIDETSIRYALKNRHELLQAQIVERKSVKKLTLPNANS